MRSIVLAALALLTASCSKPAPGSATLESYDVAEPALSPAVSKSAGAESAADPVTVSVPRIAYIFTLGFRLPGDKIAAAQAAHLALCDRLGTARCQLIGMSRKSGEGDYGAATMKLRVSSDAARGFQTGLQDAVADQGGRTVDTDIAAEDVSKDMLDTEARIRQRELLVERLTAILRNRTGKISELVEAERSVAQAQEELDQAKGWLGELRQRVAYSTFNINYNAAAPAVGSSGDSISEALSGSAGNFALGIRAIAILLVDLAPWLVIGGLLFWVGRAVVKRRRARMDADIALHDDANAP